MTRRTRVVAVVVAIAAASVLYLYWWFTRVPDPAEFGLRLVRFTVDSEFVDRSLVQVAIVPTGSGTRPLLVLMHGRGSSPDGMLSEELFAALEKHGDQSPAVLLVDGGEASYFHDRADGRWGSYVVEEAIPEAVDRLDVDFRRVAIGGISMGGFGALDLGRLHPEKWCAIGAHSPALFRSGADSPAGAFDDAEYFESHDVLAAASEGNPYGETPVWIDVGDEDPFLSTAQEFAEGLERNDADVTFSSPAGGHDESYWWAHMDEYVNFYVEHLEVCER